MATCQPSPFKFHRQFRIERRTAGGQQAQLSPELSMKRSKQDFACAHSEAPAQRDA